MIINLPVSGDKLLVPLSVRRILNRYAGEWVKVTYENGQYGLAAGEPGDIKLDSENAVYAPALMTFLKGKQRIEADFDQDSDSFILKPPVPRCQECQKTNTNLIRVDNRDYCPDCFRQICVLGSPDFLLVNWAKYTCNEFNYPQMIASELEKQKEKSPRFRNELQGFEIMKYMTGDILICQALDAILDNLLIHCANHFYNLGKDDKS